MSSTNFSQRTDKRPTNAAIANELDQIANLLEAQDANRFRVQAYRDGANTVRAAKESIAGLAGGDGQQALRELPKIGKGLARIISTFVQTGRSAIRERLQGETAPEALFTQIPGIGEELAQRIVHELGISTLEELEQAAHDGRLQTVEGFGSKRIRNIRLTLAGMLSTAAWRARRRAEEAPEAENQPDVAILLDVDEEYRRKSDAGELHQIAPRRFNPEGEAWLPILHTEREDWDFTALYSNTARAHELGKTNDWVVLYYSQDGDEDQATAVTATRGPLKGKRVVRGREAECQQYYEEKAAVA